MTNAHLRYFTAIARHGSFREAAEELHVAQSALSRQIQKLEQELGVPLFQRHARGVIHRLQDTVRHAVVLCFDGDELVDGLAHVIDHDLPPQFNRGELGASESDRTSSILALN